jgi:hypothetical protein
LVKLSNPAGASLAGPPAAATPMHKRKSAKQEKRIGNEEELSEFSFFINPPNLRFLNEEIG